jgi:hypothetical protein
MVCMKLFAMPRNAAASAQRVLGALAALVVLAGSPAHAADELTVGEAAVLAIHGPEETLRDFCVERDGALWLVLPDGTREELVTSIDDPAILNKGDGKFHPFEEAQVQAALAALRAPLAHLHAEVFLLPFPRRSCLTSSAAPGRMMLSPGVRALTPEHQHAEFVHELGHVVHYSRMPETEAGWASYRELRAITDDAIYNAEAAHANRPHEIFAEDFRALIGGSLANYSGTIENATLAAPGAVSGLNDYMRSVANASGAIVRLRMACYPNPSRETVSFVVPVGAAEALEVFDLSGRRVAALAPVVAAGATTWRWDGREGNGTPAGAGVYFARTRSGSATLRMTRVR